MKPHRRGTPHVNLLPLLDVLLCTMGILIIVLGVLNRQARENTSKRPGGRINLSAKNQETEKATLACEELQKRIDELSNAREKILAKVGQTGARLAGLKDHSQQIKNRIRDLQTTGQQRPEPSLADRAERDALHAELSQTHAERSKLENALHQARSDARYRKPAFAVIPFDGIHQTHRRPIYLECRADSIILQPEGIVFTPDDFLGPGGPGNPLASALRAAREYWSQQPPPSAEISNDPYPLLLVRPDGIIGYYLARDAMSSWDAEFGYELVDADWKLEFPVSPEPKLKAAEEQAVAEARQRMEWLAKVSPEQFERKSKTQYRLSAARGGLVREGGPLLGKDPFANDPLGGFGRSSRGSAYPNDGMGGGQGAANGFGRDAISGDPGGSRYPTGQNAGYAGTSPYDKSLGGNGAGYGGQPIGNELGPGTGGQRDPHTFATGNGGGNGGGGLGEFNQGEGNDRDRMPRAGSAAFRGGGSELGGFGEASDRSRGTAHTAGSTANSYASSDLGPRYSGMNGHRQPYGDIPGMSPGSTGAQGSAGTGSAASTSGSTGALGSTGTSGSAGGQDSTGGKNSTGGQGPASSQGSAGSMAGSSMGQSGSMGQPGSSDPSAMATGMPSPSFNFNQQQATRQTASHSLADTRGRNWAMPLSRNASVPITRPIRLECWPDRIVVMPDSRDQQSQVIPLTPYTEESIDQLVAAVREQTRGWGMAGNGMYWKPQLILNVNPNAEGRAHDLQLLLTNSGMDVKKK